MTSPIDLRGAEHVALTDPDSALALRAPRRPNDPAEGSAVRLVADLDAEATQLRTPRRGPAQIWRSHKWWILRAAVLPVHILLFAIAAFFLVRLVPGDPVLQRMDTSGGFDQEAYDRAAEAMGLDGSMWHQLIEFLKQTAHLDLGTSQVTGRSIWTEIINRLPSTVELVALGVLGAVVISLILALITLMTSSPRLHRFLAFYGRLAGSVPDFALAILGLVLLYTVLHVIPAPIGRTSPGIAPVPTVTHFPLIDALLAGNTAAFGSILSHYMLPVAVLVLAHTPSIWKQLSLGVEEQAAAPATLFKIASGASRASIYRSIMRRASASAIVMVGSLFGGLLGGVVVIEQLFGLGGVGQFAITSVDNLDFLGLQGFLVVIATVCLVVYFLVDILNMILDPRRRPGVRIDG